MGPFLVKRLKTSSEPSPGVDYHNSVRPWEGIPEDPVESKVPSERQSSTVS